MLEILERPSNVDNPIVSCLLLMAQDCKVLFFPKSTESKIVLPPGFVTSTIAIF